MKMRELIQRVDRSDKNSNDGGIEIFCDALGIECYLGWDRTFSERVKGFWLIKWLCTDTWVGYQVFYMDDEPIAVSTQTARKNPESLEFVSAEAAQKVRDFIITLLDEDEIVKPSLVDLDEEVDPTYTVSYSSQLLVDEGFFNGQPVKVERKCHRWDDPELKMTELMVCDLYGSVFKIDVSDFVIPMHLAAE